MKFKLVLREEPVELEDADGVTHHYILRELSGKQREEFQTVLQGKLTLGADGKPVGVKDAKGIFAALLTRAMVHADTRKTVSADEVGSWPGSVCEQLYKRAQELSALKEGAEGNG
jgi:hypothetical protein